MKSDEKCMEIWSTCTDSQPMIPSDLDPKEIEIADK